MRITSRSGFFLSFVLLGCGGGQVSADAPPSVPPRDAGERTSNAPPSAGAQGPGAIAGDAPRMQNSPAGSASDADAGVRPHLHDPGRAPEDIRAIVIAHRDEARACYEKSLATHPGIEGDLVLRWTIDPKGTVTQVASDPTRSQILEPGVVSCVGDVLKKIQFAPSPRGFETKAFYPFNFHPRRAPTREPGEPASAP